MKGHVGGDGNYWIGLSHLELYYLKLVLELGDISFLPSPTIRKINRMRDRVAKLYDKGTPFDSDVLRKEWGP